MTGGKEKTLSISEKLDIPLLFRASRPGSSDARVGTSVNRNQIEFGVKANFARSHQTHGGQQSSP